MLAVLKKHSTDFRLASDERSAQARVLAQAQDSTLTLRTQIAERRSRLAQIADRRVELANSDGEQAAAAKAAGDQLAELETQLNSLHEKADEFAGALAAIDHDRQFQGQALALAQDAERKAQEQLNVAQRAVARLQDQHDLLERLRNEGAGLSGGVRAVMVAARGGGSDGNRPAQSKEQSGGRSPGSQEALGGVLGTLGELIQVAPEYERAIDAALGGRMQDIVVRGWDDARAAVELLKRNQAGRATFLPLDTLRPGRASDVPKGPGIVGLASQLVHFDPAIRPTVELALNHTLVVEDLPTARRMVDHGGARRWSPWTAKSCGLPEASPAAATRGNVMGAF